MPDIQEGKFKRSKGTKEVSSFSKVWIHKLHLLDIAQQRKLFLPEVHTSDPFVTLTFWRDVFHLNLHHRFRTPEIPNKKEMLLSELMQLVGVQRRSVDHVVLRLFQLFNNFNMNFGHNRVAGLKCVV